MPLLIVPVWRRFPPPDQHFSSILRLDSSAGRQLWSPVGCGWVNSTQQVIESPKFRHPPALIGSISPSKSSKVPNSVIHRPSAGPNWVNPTKQAIESPKARHPPTSIGSIPPSKPSKVPNSATYPPSINPNWVNPTQQAIESPKTHHLPAIHRPQLGQSHQASQRKSQNRPPTSQLPALIKEEEIEQT